MKNRRLELQKKLEEILGTRNVYFQPPESIKLIYPCIIYSKEPSSVNHADNIRYLTKDQYSILVITKDQESNIPNKILNNFKYCYENQFYISDNLYHFALNLYY